MSRGVLFSLRRSRGRSQVEVAQAMRLSQSAVSKLESREDVSLAALRDYVRALGGELEVTARFGKERVAIPARELRYGERASARRVAERTPSTWAAAATTPVVAPEWLDEVDRIRAMTPAVRLQELANGAAFFAMARRVG